MTPSTPADKPAMYGKWLAWLRHHLRAQPYPSFEALAARFLKEHPRLSKERALYMAHHMGRVTPKGDVELSCDPRHRDVYSRNAVKAPVLWILADEGSLARRDLNPALIAERRKTFRDCRQILLEETGHMVHLERPARLAETVEAFLKE